MAEQGPQNKYNLKRQTKLARQTIHNAIPQMKSNGWIEVDSAEETKAKKISERYALTGHGWTLAVGAKPKLASRVPERLDGVYKQHEESFSRGRARDAERWGQLVRDVLTSRRAAPGWHLKIEIWANKVDGRIRSHIESGHPVSRGHGKRDVGKDAQSTRSRPASP